MSSRLADGRSDFIPGGERTHSRPLTGGIGTDQQYLRVLFKIWRICAECAEKVIDLAFGAGQQRPSWKIAILLAPGQQAGGRIVFRIDADRYDCQVCKLCVKVFRHGSDSRADKRTRRRAARIDKADKRRALPQHIAGEPDLMAILICQAHIGYRPQPNLLGADLCRHVAIVRLVVIVRLASRRP